MLVQQEKNLTLVALSGINAIRELTAKDLVHRDIKPENFLVNWNKTDTTIPAITSVCLSDLDALMLRSSQVELGQGTNAYFPPERFASFYPEAQSSLEAILGMSSIAAARNSAGDWWALGLVLYYMKEGDLPECSTLAENPKPDVAKWAKLIAKMHKETKKFKLKNWDKDFFGTP